MQPKTDARKLNRIGELAKVGKQNINPSGPEA